MEPSRRPFLLPLLILLFLSSCSNVTPVLFRHPQPQGKKDLSAFPAAFRGTWRDEARDQTCYLTPNHIIINKRSRLILSQEKFDTLMHELLPAGIPYERHDSSLIVDGEMIHVNMQNDSTVLYSTTHDTLFTVDASHPLRAYRGRLFLNRPRGGKWEVLVLERQGKNGMVLSYLPSYSSVLEALRGITQVVEAEVPFIPLKEYVIDPTRKELKEMLEQDLFRERLSLVRSSRDYPE